MSLGALRSIIRPVSRTILSYRATTVFSFAAKSTTPCLPSNIGLFFCPFSQSVSSTQSMPSFDSLTDLRYLKRRASKKPRRKRASMKPPGPYAWVKYVPGQPILPNNPNQGSVKRRNEKKRIKQHKAFILAEKKKRQAQLKEANRRKMIKRVERKMAAVARERTWAERLAQLKQLEKEKNKDSMA